ncbi:MAG: hydrogenase 4 subunit B, partial [Pseudolabrys sp.]
MVVYALCGVGALLALAPIAVVLAASPRASDVIYGASLVVTLVLGGIGLISLFGLSISTAALPLGLPWLGAHFRIDALASFFIIVVNLGGA